MGADNRRHLRARVDGLGDASVERFAGVTRLIGASELGRGRAEEQHSPGGLSGANCPAIEIPSDCRIRLVPPCRGREHFIGL